MSYKWRFEKRAEKLGMTFYAYNDLVKQWGFFPVENAYQEIERKQFRYLDIKHFKDLIIKYWVKRQKENKEKGLEYQT